MIIECEKCRTQFRLEDSRIYERSLKVQCSKCAHVFIVPSLKDGAADETEGSSAPPPGEGETAGAAFMKGEEKEKEPEEEPVDATAEEKTPAGQTSGAGARHRNEYAEERGEEDGGGETPPADYEPGGFSTPVTSGTFLFSREEGGQEQEDSNPEEERGEEKGGEEAREARDGGADTEPTEENPEHETLHEDLTKIVPGETPEEDAPALLQEGDGGDETEEEVRETPAPLDTAEEAGEVEGTGYGEAEEMEEEPGEETGREEEVVEDSVDEDWPTEKEEPGEADGTGADDFFADADPVGKVGSGTRINITYNEASRDEDREVEREVEEEGGVEGDAGEGEVVYDLDAWQDELRKSAKEKDFSIDLPLSEEEAGDGPEETDDDGLEPGRALTFEINGTGGEEAAETIKDRAPKKDLGPEEAERGGSSSSSSSSSSTTGGKGKAFAAVIAALAIGALVAWGLVSGKFPGFVSTRAAQEKIMEVDALKGFFVINKNMGKVFVIEAQVKNITDKAQETGGVRGVIYHGRFSGAEYSPTVSPGRIFSTEEIKDLSKRDLKRLFNGASRAVIPPRGRVPVMIIFTDLSRAVSEYGIDVMK
ncbi:MAG: zinc-ribbon domain-containing protein [Thermodesulfobacteriota bacterium]